MALVDVDGGPGLDVVHGQEDLSQRYMLTFLDGDGAHRATLAVAHDLAVGLDPDGAGRHDRAGQWGNGRPDHKADDKNADNGRADHHRTLHAPLNISLKGWITEVEGRGHIGLDRLGLDLERFQIQLHWVASTARKAGACENLAMT